jgi:hypothetical protein
VYLGEKTVESVRRGAGCYLYTHSLGRNRKRQEKRKQKKGRRKTFSRKGIKAPSRH